MRRYPGAGIAVGAIAIAAMEISFHWLLSRGTFPTLSATYLPSNYTHSRDDFAGVVDNLIPAAILGFVSGWVAFPTWTLRKLTLVAIGPAIVVAALEPIYWALIGWHQYYGIHEPKNLYQTLALFPLFDFFTAYIACWFFANVAYRGRRGLAHSRPKSAPE